MKTYNQASIQDHKIVLKIIPIIGVLFFAITLFLALRSSGTGLYEVSIYDTYTPTFWLLIIGTILFGIVSSLGEIFYGLEDYGWIPGVSLIVAANLIVLSLPILNNYAFVTQWDDVNHFSISRNILDYGQPNPENFYPISHLLASAFTLITGLDLHDTILLFPVIFFVIFILNTAFAIWVLDQNPRVRGLVITMASILLFSNFSTVFRPVHFTVCLIPLFIGWLYTSRKSRRVTDVLVALLMLIFVPFLHPLAVFSSAVLILAFGFAFILKHPHNFKNIIGEFFNPLSILLVLWLTWFTTFRVFGSTTRRLVAVLTQGLLGGHSLYGYINAADRASLQLNELFPLILYTFGSTIIYLTIAGIVIIWVLIQIIRRDRTFSEHIIALSLFTPDSCA